MHFCVQVAPSPHGGLGVFATTDFAPDDIVEVCPALDVPAEEITGTLEAYVFSSLQGDEFKTILLGYGSLYNHSFEPNVWVEEHEDGIAMIALRDIEAGEELTHDYGEEYWTTREVVPT